MTRSTTPVRQLAAWLNHPHPGAQLDIRDDIEIPQPADGEVLIKLEYTGVCHSDIHAIYGETPMTTNIAGHEGVGHVIKLGPNVPETFLNSRANSSHPGKDGSSAHVENAKYVQSIPQRVRISIILGEMSEEPFNNPLHPFMVGNQYIVSAAEDVTRIPEQLKSEYVAPLLCAGLTMYSAIAKTRLRGGDWLVLPGAGGGGLQIAVKRGFKVIAIDSGPSKRKICMDLGATAFLDFKSDDVESEVRKLSSGYGAHALICTAASEAAYTQAPKLLRNLGVLVCVGLGTDFNLPISPFEMAVRGLTVIGTSVGTPSEMDELFDMAVAGDVVPHVEIFELQAINIVLQKLAKFEIGGRVVLRIPK